MGVVNRMSRIYDDVCYECGGYVDDYSVDPDTGELVWNCSTCPYFEEGEQDED